MKYLNKTSAIGENTADNRFDSSNVISNRDGSLLERTEYLVQQSNPLADFILIDKDIFDVADADANNERWNVGYITGTEGGSADINTTTAGKLMVTVDPDASPTEARYAVNKALAVMGDVWKVTADLSLTWGTMGTTGCAAGIILSKTTTYDATNYFHFERAKTSTTDRLTLSGKLNNVAISAVTPITLADNVVALKIERWGEIYRFYYSATQNPDETWVLFTEVEDASNYMTNQIGIFLESYSKGSVDAESVVADFDNFQLFAGAGGGSIELTGDYDSTWTTAGRNGNAFERLEAVDSDLIITQSDVKQVISDLRLVDSNLSDVQSDVTIILSDLKVLDAASDSDMVVLRADIAAVASDIEMIQSDVSDVQSDVTIILSDLKVLDAAHDSDVVVLRADIATVISDLRLVDSNVSDVQSDVTIILSDLKVLDAASDSDMVVLRADLTVAKSDIVQVISDLRLVDSNLSDVQSDVTIILSDLKVLDAASDSDMVVLKSERGTEFSITKAIADKTTIITAGFLLTGVSSVGELILKRFTLQNDGTVTGGNTGGALVYTDDATYPLEVSLTNAVFAASGFLGVDIGYPLQTGKKVGIKAVTGNCTGVGSLIITMIFVRNADGATIAAV